MTLSKLKEILSSVGNVVYAHLEYDNEHNPTPPFIVFQEISKRPPAYSDDRPAYYLRTIQITLITKKKDEALEGRLERALLDNGFAFSVTTEFRNSDRSINRVYEIRLEDYTYATK